MAERDDFDRPARPDLRDLQREATERLTGERLAAERSAGQQPAGGRPAGQRPAGQRPADDGGPPTEPIEAVRRPTMRPSASLPDPLQAQRPEPAQAPGPQAPGPQAPGAQAPNRPPRLPPVRIPEAGQTAAHSAAQAGAPMAPQRPPVEAPQRPRPQVDPRLAPQRQPQQPPFQPQHQQPQQPPFQPQHQQPQHQQPQQEQPRRSGTAPIRRNGKQAPKGRTKRDQKEIQKHRAQEAKWAAGRWAVPYPTDGPKVTMGVVWFAFLMGAALLGFNYDNAAVSSVAVAVVASVMAGLAGLQTGFAWFPRNSATRSWTAGAAFVSGIAGFYGPWGVLIGLFVGLMIMVAYLMLYRGHRRSSSQLLDVLVRASLPVGLAAASLGALAYRNLPVLIALILFVSAYEVGDFLVGSGSMNPIEGPMAGIIAAGVVAFFLFLIEPDPFSSESVLMFVAVAAVSCVGGQYLASALLPRGNSWAPALRRLDSYLIVAPLWLLLLVLLPDVH